MRNSSRAVPVFTISRTGWQPSSNRLRARLERIDTITMSFRELIVEIDREYAEPLSDALMDLGALSVSVEDADADTPYEQPLFGEQGLTPERSAWQRSRVIALLAAEHDPVLLLAAATDQLAL